MVDLLWRGGQAEAAIRLEVLWNELASTRTFSLLCGYAIGNFYKQTRRWKRSASCIPMSSGIRSRPVRTPTLDP
jgi:hypothetical protein